MPRRSWFSSTPVLVALAILLSATLTGCRPQVLGVVIQDGDLTIPVGYVKQLHASVSVRGSPSTDVAWSSSAEQVAEVDATGMLTALAPGTTTVTATSTYDAGIGGSISVLVVEIGTGTVGPGGGLVASPDGIAVGVLPGALTHDVTIDIFAIDTGDPAYDVPPVPRGEMEALGGLYAIAASSDVVAQSGAPFLMALPLPDGADPSDLALAWLIEPDQVVIDAGGEDVSPERFWHPVDGAFDAEYGLLFVRTPTLSVVPRLFRLIDRWQNVRPDPGTLSVSYAVSCLGFEPGTSDEAACLAQRGNYATLLARAHAELRSQGFRRPALAYDGRFQVARIRTEATPAALRPHSLPFEWWPAFQTFGYELPVEVHEAALRRPGTGGCTDGVRGYYVVESQRMVVCFEADDWAQRSITAVHEMFHGFQFAYLLWDECTQTNLWFLEGTPDIAGLTASTGVLSKRPFPGRTLRWVTVPFYENWGQAPYRLQDFFLHLLVTQEQDLRLFLRILEAIADELASSPDAVCPIRTVVDQVITDRTMVSMGALYWRWVKYQAFERDVDLGDGVADSGPCSNAPVDETQLANATYVLVPESGSVQTELYLLPPRTASWFLVDFSILDHGDGGFGLEVRFEVDAVDATNVNVKYYREDDIPGWETCTDPVWEWTGLASGESARLTRPAHERPDRPVYALVANTHHADVATVRLEVTTAVASAP